MGEGTAIQWATDTFNPWIGCSRVSPACRFCYADTQVSRWQPGSTLWRRHGDRRITSDAYWRKPLAWDRKAKATGETRRVFCASLADVFEDHPALPEPRTRLWRLVEQTPNLDWLLLTKRPQNVLSMTPADWRGGFPPNVWLGTSTENQEWADKRIPHLMAAPAAVRFLSAEPLLGPIDLSRYLTPAPLYDRLWCPTAGRQIDRIGSGACTCGTSHQPARLHWVIVGGESGGVKARPTQVEWVRSLITQCRDAEVAPFVKQLGSPWARDQFYGGQPVASVDRKGGDPRYWPEDLRVREFPAVTRAAA